ncbi:hypothetical protein B0J14DRAFT_188983 [Halenospora varia]|nr:hypothetical protein B0J14DRAFT_188983 [Halenospora varia]
MPLPSSTLKVTGGCNCGAIRYQIEIPKVEERPLHPSSTNSNPVTFPMIATDHCNDCRRATAAVLPMWFCTPISMVTASLALRSKATPTTTAPQQRDHLLEERTSWLPGAQVFIPGEANGDSFLTFYESSENRRRSFCGRCGTNIGYTAFLPLPMPAGWPDMLDIILGTVDREHLEKEFMKPERQLWWDRGIGWVQELSCHGVGSVPIHPSFKVDKVAVEK